MIEGVEEKRMNISCAEIHNSCAMILLKPKSFFKLR